MTSVETYTAKIYLGFKEGYWDYSFLSPMNMLRQTIKEYINNDHPMCVNITETHYIYVDGSEVGACIELINYPRFPSTPIEIRNQAFALADILKEKFKQVRLSIVCTDQTYMLGEK
jgi:hypothetical protein